MGLDIAIVSQAVGIIGGLFAFYKYFSSQIAASRKEADAKLEKVIEAEAKSRHSMNNSLHAITSVLDRDLELVKSDFVRRDELRALESRLVSRSEKLEMKLDHIGDRMVGLLALEPQVKAINDRLERLLSPRGIP